MLTIEEAFSQMAQSFENLSRDEQDEVRKEIYEKITGQRYQPSASF